MLRKKLYSLLLFLFLIFGFANCYAQWNKPNISWGDFESDFQLGITSFARIENQLFVIRELCPLYRSTNNGFIWNRLSSDPFWVIAVRGNDIFGGLNYVSESTDFGNTWSILKQQIFDISSIAAEDSNIYVGTYYDGIWISNDNGANFLHDTNGLYQSNIVNTIFISDSNVLAGTNSSGIYLSSNNGKNWNQSNKGLTNLDVHTLISSFGNILAGTDNGVFLSTDNGADWIQVNNGLTDSSVYSFASVANYVFCGTNNGGIFVTTNYGGKWISIADSLTSYNISALALSGSNIIAGSSNGFIWYRTLANMIISGVNEGQNNLPYQFALYQNYPNPFNPSTIISYSVPKSSLVSIKVYDILGKEVETLVNENKSAGNYSVQFNASSKFASGVYLYRMQAGSFVETKKLILLK